jgi:uncharacterized protein (DUF427 family)
VTIRLGGQLIADTHDAVRVLETSHPPVYYLPIADFAPGSLVDAEGSSFCEFKGAARYLDVVGGGITRAQAAWNYPHPAPGYAALSDRVAVRRRDGRVHGRWSRHAAAGWLLRRLDHGERARPVQGHPGFDGVVTAPDGYRGCMASDSLTDPLEAAPAPDTQTDADSAASTDIPSTPGFADLGLDAAG